jgi:hypothetical protein
VSVIDKPAPADAPSPATRHPQRKDKIRLMPAELRAEFDRRIVEASFRGYRDLSLWLSERGYYISFTSLARYGKALDRKLEALKLATEQARIVVAATGGEDDTINEGLMRLVQGDLFRVLVELKEADPDKVDINSLARNVASICRSSVQMRRAAEEMQSALGRRVKTAERKVMAAARGGARRGLSAAAEKRIRAALLEIAELPPAVIGRVDQGMVAARRLVAEDAAAAEPSAAAAIAPAGAAGAAAGDCGERRDERSDERI